MASKWKKRLKKIGKIAAGAGALALAVKLAKGRGKGAVTGVVNPNAPKTDWITKKDAAPKRAVVDTAVTVRKPPIGRMRGAGTDLQAIAAQDKRAKLAQRGRGINPFEETAAAGAAYRPVRPGGRLNIKHGGRTRKQFGGGLNRPVAGPVAGPVARPIGGVGAGVGAGVRAPVRPLGYKKGGRVKSMGIAKRGGGVAKR